jgi:hypothetical protein
MTVKELISELEKFDGDFPVRLSSDSEGNELNEVDDLTVEELDEDEDDMEAGAVVIWPR